MVFITFDFIKPEKMSIPKLESQLNELEKKKKGLVYQSKAWYAMEGKIKQVKQNLEKAKWAEFEAR